MRADFFSPRRPAAQDKMNQSWLKFWMGLLAFMAMNVFVLLFYGSCNPEYRIWNRNRGPEKYVTGPSHAVLFGAAVVAPTNAERNIRVLFLTHKKYDYDGGMDRNFFSLYDAAKEKVSEAVLWGVGFDGYNESSTLEQNLVRQYGDVHFDMAVLYGVIPNREVFQISGKMGLLSHPFRSTRQTQLNSLPSLLQ